MDEQAESYVLTDIRARLYETLGDGVVISNHSGKEGVVTFRQTDESIQHEYHNMPKPSSVEDKRATKYSIWCHCGCECQRRSRPADW